MTSVEISAMRANFCMKWGLSWLKQHNFVVFKYILYTGTLTKLGGKVYIFLLNTYVQEVQLLQRERASNITLSYSAKGNYCTDMAK